MKQIFKEYGGVIITVIAIVALIGLVTLLMQPGGLMEGAFGNISQAFVNKSNSLIADAGDFSPKIPEGGTYTTAGGDVLTAGSKFPAAVSDGDTYQYGEYIYTYKTSSQGWSVSIGTDVPRTSETYDPILESINGEPITDMSYTFYYCAELKTAPVIPSGVTNLAHTFEGCMCLKTYAGSVDSDGDFSGYVIPSNVTNMNSTFYDCCEIKTAPIIPDSVTTMPDAFASYGALSGTIEIPCACEGQNIGYETVSIRHFEGCGH